MSLAIGWDWHNFETSISAEYVSHVFAQLATQKLNLKKAQCRPWEYLVTRRNIGDFWLWLTDDSTLKYLFNSTKKVTFFPSVFWLLIFCLANGGLDWSALTESRVKLDIQNRNSFRRADQTIDFQAKFQFNTQASVWGLQMVNIWYF